MSPLKRGTGRGGVLKGKSLTRYMNCYQRGLKKKGPTCSKRERKEPALNVQKVS